MRVSSRPQVAGVPTAVATIADHAVQIANPDRVAALVRAFMQQAADPSHTTADSVLALTRLIAATLPMAGWHRETQLEVFFLLLDCAFDQVDRPDRREGTFDA